MFAVHRHNHHTQRLVGQAARQGVAGCCGGGPLQHRLELRVREQVQAQAGRVPLLNAHPRRRQAPKVNPRRPAAQLRGAGKFGKGAPMRRRSRMGAFGEQAVRRPAQLNCPNVRREQLGALR